MDFNGGDGVTLTDGVDNVLALGNFAEDRMFAVEPWGGDVGDEELGTVGARTCISHGKDARGVMLEVWTAFVFKAIARTTHACACRVATLDHEVSNDTVEFDAFIEATRGEVEERSCRYRRLGGEYSQIDVALGGMDRDIFVSSHVLTLGRRESLVKA